MEDMPNLDGAFDYYWQMPKASANTLHDIRNALNATLDPRTPNEVRQQALDLLNRIKNQPDAPQYGFDLADDWKQADAVRYHGLQLLEHAARYKWTEYGKNQTDQIRIWVKCLAGSIREVDKTFIRNKIAQIWAEVAKRCWGGAWMDMDKLLVTMWEKSESEKGMAAKLLVLYVLETLSEDIVNSEDAVAGLRMDVLGDALNEIMVPPSLHGEFGQTSRERLEVRGGEEGWLARMCGFFASCLKQMKVSSDQNSVNRLSDCALKTLHALRPTINWINLRAAVEVNVVDCLVLTFHTDDLTLQIAASEMLYALLNRPYGQHSHGTWATLFQQALHPDRISLMRSKFESTQTAPGEDEEKYLLQKKLSEVFSVLGDAIAQHPEIVDGHVDIPAFFTLLSGVLQSQSLVVSIPVLHCWTKLLTVQSATISEPVFQALGTLVQTCSARLLRYESVSDSDANGDQTIQFLLDDFDTMPERHAFLGNYRRYCVNVIQTIARTRPTEALNHVLGQIKNMLESGPYNFGRGFDSSTYNKNGLPMLQFDAQYQVVSSALKGYSTWLSDIETIEPEDEAHATAVQDRNATMSNLQQWSYSMIDIHIDNPDVAAQILTTLVTVLRTIKPSPSFVLQMIKHLLTMQLDDNPDHTSYSEAVRAFEALRVVELQKLALSFSDELLDVYHELEPRVTALAQKHSDDPRLVWGYKSFLFMVIHRAAGIDNDERLQRLRQMVKPVYDAWLDPALNSSLNSLQAFCEGLGLGDLPEFYSSYRFAEVADWSSQQLDDAGQARQNIIKTRIDALPLRMTKSMLAAATEKVRGGTDEYEVGCALWADMIPVVLPSLLHMVQHAQAFSNLDNWSHLPPELQAVVKRTLQDRFWQSGISNESKEEFYARISGSKTSYEGFASIVRGTMRNIREQAFHIIYLMTKFDEQFYWIPNLAQPLGEALFADAGSLSPNHLHPAINLATGLVGRCPPHHRASFLPPLLTEMFTKLDAKISSEWETIARASEMNKENDELGDEMRLESVLRQLTYSMVSFVPFLLELDRGPQSEANGHAVKPSLSDVVLSDLSVLEPLMLFCTHALRMRDTRCCTTICKVFRTTIPLFTVDQGPAPGVREFISSEVLKACITSLNEPYFADMQKDLAALIAQIILIYAPLTQTPTSILLSLPNMSALKVEKAVARICKLQNERQQRSIVLELLEGVRGVSIYEAGKIARETPRKAEKVQPQYMETEQQPRIVNGDESGLDGVAGMFGDA